MICVPREVREMLPGVAVYRYPRAVALIHFIDYVERDNIDRFLSHHFDDDLFCHAISSVFSEHDDCTDMR